MRADPEGAGEAVRGGDVVYAVHGKSIDAPKPAANDLVWGLGFWGGVYGGGFDVRGLRFEGLG